MTVVYGPLTSRVPDAYHSPSNKLWAGRCYPGQLITIQWSGAQNDAGSGTGYDVEIYENSGGVLSVLDAYAGNWAADAGGHTYTYSLLATWDVEIWTFNGGTGVGGTGGTGYLTDLQIAVTNGTAAAFCQYGTSRQPQFTGAVTITTGLIDLILLSIPGGAFLTVIFDTLVYLPFATNALCGGPPPTFVPFTVEEVARIPWGIDDALRQKIWTNWQAVAWPYFCQCTAAPPGDPPPLPFPDIHPVAAGGGGTTIQQFTNCDEGDICTMLNSLQRQLAAIASTVVATRLTNTLIQRQSTPFTYLPGTIYSGLTGSGLIDVSGILAVCVTLTTLPAAVGEIFSSPNALFHAGWVTPGTADGWRTSAVIGHNPEWIDVAFDDTRVGYSFIPGVVATIQTFSHAL